LSEGVKEKKTQQVRGKSLPKMIGNNFKDARIKLTCSFGSKMWFSMIGRPFLTIIVSQPDPVVAMLTKFFIACV